MIEFNTENSLLANITRLLTGALKIISSHFNNNIKVLAPPSYDPWKTFGYSVNHDNVSWMHQYHRYRPQVIF